MNVREAINERRAYRSFIPVEINDDIVKDLASCVALAPSCFNYQPWRFVFVYDRKSLDELKVVLPEGNRWAHDSSMMIAVFAKKEDDCVLGDRQYYLFDTGMATGFLILRATELGLVAHPIAGYDDERAKEILGIPDEMTLITIVMVGKHTHELKPYLSEKQVQAEGERPQRKDFSEFAFIDRFNQGLTA